VLKPRWLVVTVRGLLSLKRRRRPMQRKADESTAAAALGYRRPRLGIDVAPVMCPIQRDDPVDRGGGGQ
jgi:hypothetical protein